MSEVWGGSGISEKEWGEVDSGESEGRGGDGEDGEEGTTLFEHSLDRLAPALSWGLRTALFPFLPLHNPTPTPS
jgi:hypothetical protein